MRPVSLAVMLAIVFGTQQAVAQSLLDRKPNDGADLAAAAQCTIADFTKAWLLTFYRKGEPVLCVFEIDAERRVNGQCGVKTTTASATITGRLDGPTSCDVTGTVKMTDIGKFTVAARMSADRSTMAGVLIDGKERFMPLSVSRWPVN